MTPWMIQCVHSLKALGRLCLLCLSSSFQYIVLLLICPALLLCHNHHLLSSWLYILMIVKACKRLWQVYTGASYVPTGTRAEPESVVLLFHMNLKTCWSRVVCACLSVCVTLTGLFYWGVIKSGGLQGLLRGWGAFFRFSLDQTHTNTHLHIHTHTKAKHSGCLGHSGSWHWAPYLVKKSCRVTSLPLTLQPLLLCYSQQENKKTWTCVCLCFWDVQI